LQRIVSCSVCWNDIHSKVVKSSFDLYSDVFVHLVNMCLSQGIFPDEMKVVRVIPLYKSGDGKLITNYRPVSILPIFSKIFERVIYNRILTFINDNNLIYNLQFGFRKNYNTTMAVITLIDKIVTGIDKNEMTLGTFLDFSKAFDTINHVISLNKLNKYGIRGVANRLIGNYLSNRKQFVSYDNSYSETLSINCGMPQGSILGPLFFVLHINDIHLVCCQTMPIVFADDSSLFVQGKDIKMMTNKLNNELNHVYNWVNSNRLSLNIEKTYCMLFKGKKKQISIDLEVIYILEKKVAKGISIINRAKHSFNSSSLIMLYYSFVYPYINYGLEVWGSVPKTKLVPILKLQKRILRITTFSPTRTPSSPLFSKFSVLDIYNVYIYKDVLFMCKIEKN